MPFANNFFSQAWFLSTKIGHPIHGLCETYWPCIVMGGEIKLDNKIGGTLQDNVDCEDFLDLNGAF